VLDGSGNGPTGDISYRDGRATSYPNSDPFLVIGAEKHDAGPAYPSFSGWIDEVRLSTVVRYASNFTPPAAPFVADGDTVLLYHFDDGTPNTPCTGAVTDSSIGTQNPGQCSYGGTPPAGPVYSAETPFGPPLRDVVVLARRPLTVRLPSSGQTIVKRVPVVVRNASDAPGAEVTVQLNATNVDCPAGVLAGTPDFDPSTPGDDPVVTLPPKRSRTGKLTLSFDPNDFLTPNSMAPVRCRIALSPLIVAPAGAVDPASSNDGAILEIDVFDRGDVSGGSPHENLIQSLSPVTIRVGRNQSGKSKKVGVRVTNADLSEPTGDALQANVVTTDCPPGSVGAVDFDPAAPGDQDTATVPGRKSRSGKLVLNFSASQVSVLNRYSPLRCVVRLGVTGPGTDPETSNNQSDLVVDVYDANDF
jgi:hypothetical protein